jgi:hypothetical protein
MLPYIMKKEESGIFTYQLLDWKPCTEEYI